MLLFYPHRTQDDIILLGSYWDEYALDPEDNLIPAKSLDVSQKIRDIFHNCAKLTVARDDLVKFTIMISHDDDMKCQEKDSENIISFDEVADMMHHLDILVSEKCILHSVPLI